MTTFESDNVCIAGTSRRRGSSSRSANSFLRVPLGLYLSACKYHSLVLLSTVKLMNVNFSVVHWRMSVIAVKFKGEMSHFEISECGSSAHYHHPTHHSSKNHHSVIYFHINSHADSKLRTKLYEYSWVMNQIKFTFPRSRFTADIFACEIKAPSQKIEFRLRDSIRCHATALGACNNAEILDLFVRSMKDFCSLDLCVHKSNGGVVVCDLMS